MRLLFALILLTSCASTLTTQELQALTKGKSDYELCSEIANVIWYGGSLSKYTVDELKERRVNCMDHSEAILRPNFWHIKIGVIISWSTCTWSIVIRCSCERCRLHWDWNNAIRCSW